VASTNGIGIGIATRAPASYATVTATGAVVPHDGSPSLDWWIAADDRWHDPRSEPTVRQRRLLGTPVVETAMRVPSGDAVLRAYAVADEGGRVVVEVENRSRLPFAVGFSRPDLAGGLVLTAPPPSAPDGVRVVLPVAHGSIIRIGLDSRRASVWPSAERVARGWVAHVDRKPRVVVPDAVWFDSLVEAQCDAVLTDPDPADDEAVILTALVRCRCGEPAGPSVSDVAKAAARIARRGRQDVAWDAVAALDGAVELLAAAGERAGAVDAAAMRARLGLPSGDPDDGPDGVRRAVWLVRQLVRSTPGGVELFPAFPRAWVGEGAEIYEANEGGSSVSAGVRWHGGRPALLWESTPPVTLRCGLDPSWSSREPRGDVLLASPVTR
jgi:hypothetical protein